MTIPQFSRLRSMSSIEAARERIRQARNKMHAKERARLAFESEYPAPSVVNMAATIQADRRDAAIMLRYMRATIREQQREES